MADDLDIIRQAIHDAANKTRHPSAFADDIDAVIANLDDGKSDAKTRESATYFNPKWRPTDNTDA